MKNPVVFEKESGSLSTLDVNIVAAVGVALLCLAVAEVDDSDGVPSVCLFALALRTVVD